MKNLFPVREVLAAAVYAFRANENIVVKDMHHPNHKDKFPNKAYLYKHFVDSTMCAELTNFDITEDLLHEADSIAQQLEYIITMAALTQGQINLFITNCAKLIAQDTVDAKSFGTLVWIPKIVHDYELKSAAKMKSAVLEHGSKYIGRVNDRVQVHFNLIEKRFIGSINCWAAYGHTDEGNLIKFLTKHEALCTTGNIKGRIKAIDKDNYHGDARVTSLNHVKQL